MIAILCIVVGIETLRRLAMGRDDDLAGEKFLIGPPTGESVDPSHPDRLTKIDSSRTRSLQDSDQNGNASRGSFRKLPKA